MVSTLPGIVTITSDFGLADGYVAAMKGQVLNQEKHLIIADITHEIEKHNILRAAFIISVTYENFPPGTVHLCVVDPGVGSGRAAIALNANGHLFIGPDNGIFTHVIHNSSRWQCRRISRTDLFRKEISNTFHGRDIFAPVAGALAAGKVTFESLGSIIEQPVEIEIHRVRIHDEIIEGAVIHIDNFGNIITNIRQNHLAQLKQHGFCINLAEHKQERVYSYFEEAPENEPALIWGSNGYLEIFIRQRTAAKELNITVGQKVTVERKS